MISFPVKSQVSVCAPRYEIISGLTDDYDETQVSIGLDKFGNVVEIFVSDLGTWSFIVTRPDGVTCIISAGQNWERIINEKSI